MLQRMGGGDAYSFSKVGLPGETAYAIESKNLPLYGYINELYAYYAQMYCKYLDRIHELRKQLAEVYIRNNGLGREISRMQKESMNVQENIEYYISRIISQENYFLNCKSPHKMARGSSEDAEQSYGFNGLFNNGLVESRYFDTGSAEYLTKGSAGGHKTDDKEKLSPNRAVELQKSHRAYLKSPVQLTRDDQRPTSSERFNLVRNKYTVPRPASIYNSTLFSSKAYKMLLTRPGSLYSNTLLKRAEKDSSHKNGYQVQSPHSDYY